MLHVLFLEAGITTLVYEGTLTGKARTEVLNDFKNKADKRVLLLGLTCGAEGLNITVANHVIFSEPWWNPMTESQGEGRIHRLGQKKSCFVYRPYVVGSIEERVMTIRARKLILARALHHTNIDDPRFQASMLALDEELYERRDRSWYMSLLQNMPPAPLPSVAPVQRTRLPQQRDKDEAPKQQSPASGTMFKKKLQNEN